MRAPLISCRNLTLWFPGAERAVLDDLTWDIAPNAITIITGQNGAGKSQLLECTAGLQPRASANWTVNSVAPPEWNRASTKHLGIAYVPQRLPRPDSIRVDELAHLLQRRHQSWWYRRGQTYARLVTELERLQFGGMDHVRANASLDLLTNRELRLVYLLCALIDESPVLLLDEPASDLATNDRQILYRELARWASVGRSVVIVAHPSQQAEQQLGAVSSVRIEHLRLDSGKLANNRTPPALPHSIPASADRCRPPIVNWRGRLQVGVESCAIQSGSVVVVRGPSEREYFEFVKDLGDRCDDGSIMQYLSIVDQRAGTTFVARFIGFGGADARLALDRPMIENCLLGRWTDPRWCSAGVWISRSRAISELHRPIVEDVRLDQGDPQFLPAALSGGNRQRLVVGSTLFDPCDLLIVADPLYGLDNVGEELVLSLLLDRAVRGLCVIVCLTSDDAAPWADSLVKFEIAGAGHV